MSLLRCFIILCALSSLGGCAFGQKIDYRQSSPSLSVRSDTPVEISVIDERPYVVRNDKSPTFVGRIRGLYYNPFNVNTATGQPLASDISEAVRSALAKSSINAAVTQSATHADQGHRLLLLRLREWKMDAYMKVRFDYDITASVVDEHGIEIASKNAKNSGPVANVIAAGTDALSGILNASEIVDALSSKPRQLTMLPATMPPAENKPISAYDQCMRRVGKISDPTLRASSMAMCDNVE